MDDKQTNEQKGKRPSTNSRQIRHENDRHFLKMVVFTLVAAGGLTIELIYGPAALLTALPILLGGAGLIVVPYLVLKTIEWLYQRLSD
jgi:hypothetical protein